MISFLWLGSSGSGSLTETTTHVFATMGQTDGLVQGYRIPIANVLELLQSGTKPLKSPGGHYRNSPVTHRLPVNFICYFSIFHAWWRHQMGTFSALLAICAGNSPVTGEFHAQGPVTRSFDVFFDLNKRLSKQWWVWWFETPSRPLWRHCNELTGCQSISSATSRYSLDLLRLDDVPW